VGDENRRLGPVEAQELRYDKGESTFDGSRARDATRADFDPKSIARYGRAIRAGDRIDTALGARGLAIQIDDHVAPTVAGLLMLGTDPQRTMPEAFVRLLRYQGNSRETGARSNIIQDARIDGSLPSQVREARRVLRRWLPRADRLGDSGRFEPTTIIPEPAWLEAVVNAVIHRSYAIGGDHIRVELFDDRLEVESPGRLPGLVRLDNIRRTRFARNPRIARAMADLDYGRELGEGIDRMYQEMERVGLPDPVLHPGPASVRVVFLMDPLASRILALLPPGSERFAEHLSRVARVTTTEAVQLLAVSRPTALAYLHRLEDAGLMEAVRMSPNDPRGYWRLRRTAASEP
jgi:ATP-dependent DNA helicase RecG